MWLKKWHFCTVKMCHQWWSCPPGLSENAHKYASNTNKTWFVSSLPVLLFECQICKIPLLHFSFYYFYIHIHNPTMRQTERSVADAIVKELTFHPLSLSLIFYYLSLLFLLKMSEKVKLKENAFQKVQLAALVSFRVLKQQACALAWVCTGKPNAVCTVNGFNTNSMPCDKHRGCVRK